MLEAHQRIGQVLMRTLLEQQEERRNAEIRVNPEIGKRLHLKERGRS
ncbi:hypothetical protein [uncultured Chloroflexus sp.]|nr:hypothetical protein [uncultured Chloroflexus sp.]